MKIKVQTEGLRPREFEVEVEEKKKAYISSFRKFLFRRVNLAIKPIKITKSKIEFIASGKYTKNLENKHFVLKKGEMVKFLPNRKPGVKDGPVVFVLSIA